MIELRHESGHAISLFVGGPLLCRYVYAPDTPEAESPKPYFHPINSLGGSTLTNFRPNDHPWHHGLSLTLNYVSGVNFWGGPTCTRERGYQWLADHGTQRHLAWSELKVDDATAELAHTLEWRRGTDMFFNETRRLHFAVDYPARSWSLRWRSQLTNVSGRSLTLGNPHSNAGLVGSHYTGLAFRGARELLDDHLDSAIKVTAEGGLEGIAAVHGAKAKWMEWHGQLDTSLERVIIRFENNTGPMHWFVRRNSPLAAFPPHFDQNLELAEAAQLELDHTLTFSLL